MRYSIFAAAALAFATPAAADVYESIYSPAVYGGQILTTTTRITGLEPGVDTVDLAAYFQIDYGVDWFEDFGDGLEIWGNEYFDAHDSHPALGGTDGFNAEYLTSYGFTLEFYEWNIDFFVDGQDFVSVTRLFVKPSDRACTSVPMPDRVEYDICGYRSIFGFFETYYAVSGVNEDKAVFSSVTTVRTVPEPASWAMLISGFGLIGAALRRRRRVAA